jgi:hypothetical protein
VDSSAAADEPTVFAVESIPEVVFVERCVVAPVRHLVEDTVRALHAELGVTGPTYLCALDSPRYGSTPAMATADESTAVETIEPVLVVVRLFLVVGGASPGQF